MKPALGDELDLVWLDSRTTTPIKRSLLHEAEGRGEVHEAAREGQRAGIDQLYREESTAGRSSPTTRRRSTASQPPRFRRRRSPTTTRSRTRSRSFPDDAARARLRRGRAIYSLIQRKAAADPDPRPSDLLGQLGKLGVPLVLELQPRTTASALPGRLRVRPRARTRAVTRAELDDDASGRRRSSTSRSETASSTSTRP